MSELLVAFHGTLILIGGLLGVGITSYLLGSIITVVLKSSNTDRDTKFFIGAWVLIGITILLSMGYAVGEVIYR